MFRGFIDVCTWFSGVLKTCGLKGQVLYLVVLVHIVACYLNFSHNFDTYMHSKHRLQVGSLGPLGHRVSSVLMGFGCDRSPRRVFLCSYDLNDVHMLTLHVDDPI